MAQFENPVQFLYTIRPNIKLHKWQIQTLMQIGGQPVPGSEEKFRPTKEEPLFYNLVAANGSGKDAFIISVVAVWFAISGIRRRCIITSKSHDQLKNQTYKYISDLAKEANIYFGEKIFEIVEFHCKSELTGSEIKCFVTDEAGSAEGYHPFPEFPNAEMMVIINEAKSISDELFQAFSRFTGYNYWLEISSPGGASGRFYNRSKAGEVWPLPLKLGKFYTRYITAYECPHISQSHIDTMRAEYGETHELFRSSILAEFTSADDSVVIPEYKIQRAYGEDKEFQMAAPRKFGKNFAGLDLGAGRDETALAICNGNQILGIETHVSAKTNETCAWLMEMFKKWDLKPEDVVADDNGVGRGIIGNLRDLGWDGMSLFLAQSPAFEKSIYGNKGAEMWFKFGRMIEEISFKNVLGDEILRRELTNRYYTKKLGFKTYLESKDEARAKGHPSPNRADAIILAFSQKPYDWMRSNGEYATPENKPRIDMSIVVENMAKEREQRLFGGPELMHTPIEVGTYRAGYNATGSLHDLIVMSRG